MAENISSTQNTAIATRL